VQCRIPTIADSDCERLRTVVPIDCGQHCDDCGQVAPIDGFMGSLVGGCVKVATVKYFYGLRAPLGDEPPSRSQ
jgi:hypothetical protein